jgi:hypothetical protein
VHRHGAPFGSTLLAHSLYLENANNWSIKENDIKLTQNAILFLIVS